MNFRQILNWSIGIGFLALVGAILISAGINYWGEVVPVVATATDGEPVTPPPSWWAENWELAVQWAIFGLLAVAIGGGVIISGARHNDSHRGAIFAAQALGTIGVVLTFVAILTVIIFGPAGGFQRIGEALAWLGSLVDGATTSIPGDVTGEAKDGNIKKIADDWRGPEKTSWTTSVPPTNGSAPLAIPAELGVTTLVTIGDEWRAVEIPPGTCLEGDPIERVTVRKVTSRDYLIKSSSHEPVDLRLTRRRTGTCS